MKLFVSKHDFFNAVGIAAVVLYCVKKVRERTVVNSVLKFDSLTHYGDAPALSVSDGMCTVDGGCIVAGQPEYRACPLKHAKPKKARRTKKNHTRHLA